MNNKLIIELSATGHRIEYIEILISNVIKNNIDNVYFLLDSKFRGKIKLLDDFKNVFYFPEIKFDFLKFRTFFFIRKINKELSIDVDFYMFLNELIIPLLLFSTTKSSGILFHTNYRLNRSKTFREKLKDLLLFKFVKNKYCNNVYVLNDLECVEYYNQMINKFKYISDPIMSFKSQDSKNEVEKLKVKFKGKNKINFLHAGVLSSRKGTDIFLKSLKFINDVHHSKLRVFIIGKISSDFIDNWSSIISEVPTNIEVIYELDFVSNDKLQAYIEYSDCFILPYRNYQSSSGMIVRGQLESKNVVATNKGLIQDILKDYPLFLPLDKLSEKCLSNLIIKYINNGGGDVNMSRYLDDLIEKTDPTTFFLTIIMDSNEV